MVRKRLSERAILWYKDPKCYWCRKPTRLLEITGGQAPDDMATIDHLYNKLDKNRQDRDLGIIKKNRRGKTVVRRHVLACYACNQKRGLLDCQAAKSGIEFTVSETCATRLPQKEAEEGLINPDMIPIEADWYLDRHYRLRDWKRQVEEGLDGLISVMGLPLKGGK